MTMRQALVASLRRNMRRSGNEFARFAVGSVVALTLGATASSLAQSADASFAGSKEARFLKEKYAANWLTSVAGQSAIGGYRIGGEQVFFSNAPTHLSLDRGGHGTIAETAKP